MFTSTPFIPRPHEGESGAIGGLSISAVRQSTVSSRARGSFAYPLQQVFEETRSMLMNETNEMSSIFTANLERTRLTLAPTGVEDFIGAMDTLHEQFCVAIDCMTERSQIFEVINTWMQFIDVAAQHQKTNETDLSDTDYRKLQKLLRLECETWNLISVLYFQRLNDEERPEPFNEEIQDEFCLDEETYLRKIVDSDVALQEMFYIVGWLEANFEKFGPPDLSEKLFIWENTLETIRKDQLLGKPSSKSMVTQVDPDAPAREGKQLHPLDQEETMKVLKGAFYYSRTGHIDNAITYLVKSGERIKASALSGFQYNLTTVISEREEEYVFQPNPLEEGEEGPLPAPVTARRIVKEYSYTGNPKRDLWKLISWKACERNTMSKYDRALLGSVCGHRQAMLGVANTWEDRLWAFLKASINVSMEGRLRELSKPNNRADLPESYWSQKLSVPECIQKVDAFSSIAVAPEDAFFQSLQKNAMMDKIGDFIEELSATLPNLLNDYDHPLLNGHLVRFFTHLLLFFGVVDLPYSQELLDICVERYVAVLVDINLITKTPYYIQKLTDDKKIPTIIRHITADRRLARDDIIEFLKSSQINDLDVLGIGMAVVDKMRDEEDDFAVENLDWISCCYGIAENSSQVMYEFLKYTIWISRKYLTLGNIEKVQKLIGRVTPENVAEVGQISESLENTLVREYICYKVYLEAEEALSIWRKAMGQKPSSDIGELPVAATKADRTVYDNRKREYDVAETKWRRFVDYHLNNTIEKFLAILKFPFGWLRDCYDPEDEDETIHVGGVRRIIIRNVINILLRLIKDKNDNRTTRDFLYVLCDDERNILRELSPDAIGNVFQVMEIFTRQKVSNIMFLPK